MIRQYHHASRKPVKDISIGDIIYIQDGIRPLTARPSWAPVIRRNPWIVEGWENRRYARPGREDSYLVGGHTAVVRSLRTGKRITVADWILKASTD